MTWQDSLAFVNRGLQNVLALFSLKEINGVQFSYFKNA